MHKILSFTMAFVVLFSTLSFTVESHYCGSSLVDTAIFTKAKVCGEDITSDAPAMKGCCKNEIEVVKGQDNLKLNVFDDLDLSQQLFITSFVYAYTALFESLPKQIIPHKNYSPPNLVFDIQLLDDVFLI
nr:hypothetical protein [Lacinutrix venerupis]